MPAHLLGHVPLAYIEAVDTGGERKPPGKGIRYMFDWLSGSEFGAFVQVVLIDLVLAGDNAVVIGLAAAGLAPELRRKSIIFGILAATVLRIGLAVITTQLLAIVGLLFAGGLLLLWVAFKMWQELHHSAADDAAEDAATAAVADATVLNGEVTTGAKPSGKTLKQALVQIVIADMSMSLDNVLAVAGAAREHTTALAFGLFLSVALMGFAAAGIAKLLNRFRWIAYVGLAVILFVALRMVWHGAEEILHPMQVALSH